jgi:processive 1,2-diacylglycerol beta-glucosyltransferase/1,2-diacylglycerol 3-beta-galactosyltransferase
MRKYLEAVIINEKPDKIVILHFFCINPILKILKKHNISIPVQILITDPFTPHPMWFLEKKQSLIVFSKELESKVNRKKSGHNVARFPFPIDEKYSKILSADEVLTIKKRLGYDPVKKMVLMLGGGDGVPKGERLLQRLLEEKFEHEIGIVCGNNTILRQGAENQKKKYNAVNLKIYGYVDFIYDLLNIADLVITKCGASTIMEILNLKKVPIVIDYIWEQEQGNVDYIKNKKLGIYEPRVRKLPELIRSLLEADELRLSYKKNIDKENITNGVGEVAKYLNAF